MTMQDCIMHKLGRAPMADWRGQLQGEAWYEDTLLDAIVPPVDEGYFDRKYRSQGSLTDADLEHDRAVDRFWEDLDGLVRERKVGRSYVYNPVVDPAIMGENNVGRDYFVWLKTPAKTEWTDRLEAGDREVIEMFRSLNPAYGETFTFGRDDEVLDLQ